MHELCKRLRRPLHDRAGAGRGGRGRKRRDGRGRGRALLLRPATAADAGLRRRHRREPAAREVEGTCCCRRSSACTAGDARKLLRARRVDAIHAHCCCRRVVARHAGGMPYLVTSHGDLRPARRLMEALKRKVAASSAAMTVVSSAMAAEARRIGYCACRGWRSCRWASTCARFVPDPAIAREADALLAVGRLVPKKGLNFLLDAMPAIVRARLGRAPGHRRVRSRGGRAARRRPSAWASRGTWPSSARCRRTACPGCTPGRRCWSRRSCAMRRATRKACRWC
ncbi:MAG: glycosyltransferase [Lysobacterales bacterium]